MNRFTQFWSLSIKLAFYFAMHNVFSNRCENGVRFIVIEPWNLIINPANQLERFDLSYWKISWILFDLHNVHILLLHHFCHSLLFKLSYVHRSSLISRELFVILLSNFFSPSLKDCVRSSHLSLIFTNFFLSAFDVPVNYRLRIEKTIEQILLYITITIEEHNIRTWVLCKLTCQLLTLKISN